MSLKLSCSISSILKLSAQDVSASAEEQLVTVEEITSSASQLAQMAKALQEQIKRFKL